MTQVSGADVSSDSTMTTLVWLGSISWTDWIFCCCWYNSKLQSTQMHSKLKMNSSPRIMVPQGDRNLNDKPP